MVNRKFILFLAFIVGSQAPILVFDSLGHDIESVIVCNKSEDQDLWLSHSSSISPRLTPGWVVQKNGCAAVDATSDLWAVYEQNEASVSVTLPQ